MSLAIFRLESFVGDPSLGNFRLKISLENFRLRLKVSRVETFALKRYFGSLVWKLSPGIFCLIYSAWDVSLGGFRLGSFVWQLSGVIRLGTSVKSRPLYYFRLETVARNFSLGNFRLTLFVWDPSFGSFRCGTVAL